jgi:CheY-like chemotaxis protein
MVYGFAQQSGGHVSITSKEGSGTSISIILPLAERGEADTQANEADDCVSLRGSETVLAVEDDPQVLEFVTSQLRALGYNVTSSSTGAEALMLLKQRQNFDLLFTDVVLPSGLSGIELSNAVLSIDPKLKVLFTSGYSEEVFQQHGRPAHDVPILRKPYKRAELAKALRAALENS